MKEFEVKVCYSGYSTHIVRAENEEEALEIARLQPINQASLLDSLEPWNEADSVEEL